MLAYELIFNVYLRVTATKTEIIVTNLGNYTVEYSHRK